MRPTELLLRCFAEKQDGIWSCVCIDLNLAAQSHDLEEAKSKLVAQIADFVADAVVTDGGKFAKQLLNRKAPWSLQAKYYLFKLLSHDHKTKERCAWSPPLPMIPQKAA